MVQLPKTQEVACPKCGAGVEVPIPGAGVELKASPYAMAYGDHAKVECSGEHTVWVYFC